MKIEVCQATFEDSRLCYQLTEQAMRGYVETTWGKWDPSSQWLAHSESFDPNTHWLVFGDGALVGVVAALLEASHIRLLKLYLASNAQNRGIGAVVLQSLFNSAAARRLPVRLRVLAVNTRAQAFYLGHGFREAFRTVERVFMEHPPCGAAIPRRDESEFNA